VKERAEGVRVDVGSEGDGGMVEGEEGRGDVEIKIGRNGK